MKSNPNIDELLCSFVDGELPARQQTEVQRMVARDPQVSQRLRQLQNCKNLISALPRAEAPGDMVEQIRLSLERRTLLGERPASSNGRAGRWHLRMRRLTAAAAMIALLGVLGLVVYQIVSPIHVTDAPSPMVAIDDLTPPASTLPPVVVASETGFSGRLEFRTTAMAQAHSFITRAIQENGLADRAELESADGRRVYHVTCSRDVLSRLVADLNEVWRNSESGTLVVETDRFAESVVLKPVTFQQAARIISQDSAEASVAVAKMEKIAQEMPGRDIVAALGEDSGAALPLPVLPRPVLTSGDVAARAVSPAEDGPVRTSLTIVLLDARP